MIGRCVYPGLLDTRCAQPSSANAIEPSEDGRIVTVKAAGKAEGCDDGMQRGGSHRIRQIREVRESRCSRPVACHEAPSAEGTVGLFHAPDLESMRKNGREGRRARRPEGTLATIRIPLHSGRELKLEAETLRGPGRAVVATDFGAWFSGCSSG